MAQAARDIHLSTWLSKGEVGGAQSYLRICAKERLSEEEQRLSQVCVAHVTVDVQSLDLVEEAVSTSGYSLVAINTSWAKHSYRWLLALHDTCLHGGCVGAQ